MPQIKRKTLKEIDEPGFRFEEFQRTETYEKALEASGQNMGRGRI